MMRLNGALWYSNGNDCRNHTKYDICIRMSKLERITETMPAEMAAKLRAAMGRR